MSVTSTKHTWRDSIFAHFSEQIAGVSRLTVVADPDGLLTEQGVVDGVRARGFDVIAFEDHVAFRYAYERRFREVWDAGNKTNLVVVLRAPRSSITELPFDLLLQAKRNGRVLSFSLAEMFPSFAPHVLADLDRRDLDVVASAEDQFKPGSLGENATRDFLLRNVFQLDPASVHSASDLLRALLRLHYSGRIVPDRLGERFVSLLRSDPKWIGWPLEILVPGRAAFFEFLQERWPLFLAKHFPSDIHQTSVSVFNITGPVDLPFDHGDVHVYIDNLFTVGMLTPISGISRSLVKGTWMAVGVAGSEAGDNASRLKRLLELLKLEVNTDDADHSSWLLTAIRWAEAVALRWQLPPDGGNVEKDAFQKAHSLIEQQFQHWMTAHYSSLHSLSFLPRPVMLHQIPRYMKHRLSSNAAERVAVVVVDGLAFDQWVVVRQQMPPNRWNIDESAIFAWVPTLTSVSRQSIFAGDPPFYFAPSIHTTAKEEQHWLRFWENNGVKRDEVVYACQGSSEDDDGFVAKVEAKIDHHKCRVAGIVIGKIDEMLHGAVTGTGGMHTAVRHWADQGALWRLLDVLIDRGFDVILTADHGNVAGIGVGRPNVGVTAERGQRVHIFEDEVLRSATALKYPGTVEWPDIGLPRNYLALMAPQLKAFFLEGRETISHGGICLEEVVVPFVTVAKST